MAEIIQWITRQGFPCLFQLITGLYCPGCGGTRAVRALLAGNPGLSFQYHPLVLYAAVVITAEFLSFAISKAVKNPRWYLGHETLFIYIAAIIVVVNWVFKNVMLVFCGIDLLPPWT